MNIDIEALPEEQRKRHMACNKRLTQLWEKNAEFIKEYRTTYNYYINKSNHYIKGRSNRKEFQEKFLPYMNDLFYQGYYMGLEMLEHPEVTIENQFLLQPNGLIRDQTFDILRKATENINECFSHDGNLVFEKEIKEKYPTFMKELSQAKIDIGCSGTYQAFLNEREKREVWIRKEPPEVVQGILARSDDYLFVDPQKFITCVSTSKTNELWELYYWSGIESRDRKIGEVTLSCYEKEAINELYKHSPYYQGFESFVSETSKYHVSLILDEKIEEAERLHIISTIADSLTQRRSLEYTDVTVSLIISSEYNSYQYNPNKE